MRPHIGKGKKEEAVAKKNQWQLKSQGPDSIQCLFFNGKLIFNSDNPFHPPDKISGHAFLKIGLNGS